MAPVEERHDLVLEIVPPAYTPTEDILPVVVAPRVAVDHSTAKERPQERERSDAPLALRDDELRPNLPAEPHRRTPVDVDAEAAFAVDESSDPSLEPEPFLLIVCTRHLVTTVQTAPDGE